MIYTWLCFLQRKSSAIFVQIWGASWRAASSLTHAEIGCDSCCNYKRDLIRSFELYFPVNSGCDVETDWVSEQHHHLTAVSGSWRYNAAFSPLFVCICCSLTSGGGLWRLNSLQRSQLTAMTGRQIAASSETWRSNRCMLIKCSLLKCFWAANWCQQPIFGGVRNSHDVKNAQDSYERERDRFIMYLQVCL